MEFQKIFLPQDVRISLYRVFILLGKMYKFRVRAVNAEGESEPLESEKPIEAKNPYDEPGKPGKPTVKNYDRSGR